MTTNNDIIDGWEYFTTITPQYLPKEQTIQNKYLQEYNLAYNKFINSLFLSVENLNIIKSEISLIIDNNTGEKQSKYKFIIDCSENNDIINMDDDNYNIKFLKSKFLHFKKKKIKNDLINYYKPLGFYIKGPIELISNKKCTKYFLELCWHNDKE